MTAKVQLLKQALDQKRLVRFYVPYDSGSVTGYVLGIGPRLVLISVIDETIRLNGFQCFLVADVRRLEVPFRYEKFNTFALRRRGQIYPTKPAIDLGDIAQLINSASRTFALITIHRERLNPDTCRIGKVIEVSESHLSLLEIGPDAKWETKPTRLRLQDITRIDFGGGYEEALELVGGPAPVLEQRKLAR